LVLNKIAATCYNTADIYVEVFGGFDWGCAPRAVASALATPKALLLDVKGNFCLVNHEWAGRDFLTISQQ